MPDELALLDAVGQAELVRAGKISARELVDAAIARVEHIAALLAFTMPFNVASQLEQAEVLIGRPPIHA
jgi:Asp-tRNA(Asn)/Glu-tRNA(Gln) amidotransferase A subunit family amidase